MEETCGTEQDPVSDENVHLWQEDTTETDVTMARRSQCSESGDNPLDPNYLPPHYREEYRLAIDALIEEDLDGYYKFLQFSDVVDFLAPSEIDYIQTSIQLPKQSAHPEHRYLDTAADGSSDTYWPMHSDLDAPGLDLGWPQIHHFIGPTEVTTLVNPAAPDMPSIKEQARRLIKNAQMVIAIVMDVFTDVDIFADILNAAMRNVAVYLLLDETNVQYFLNMVNNCRVNVEAIQFLRVRTVTGISYHCRTGKSFKGQMLDRFILTDCRAVLSGNYSFMWSYEKLHRCMAHLFLGQLVSTFDEEFRILYAQSEPLDIKNMEDMTILPKHPYPSERPMLRGKYAPGQPEEWNRLPYEENMDWRRAPVKRQETFHGPMDIYNRYPSPQSRLDPQPRLEPPFDQGPPRITEGLAHKRHHFGEGGPGRYGLPYQQPGLPDVEPPGRPFYRGQQPQLPGHEPDYGGYGQIDQFWNQDFQQEEPYPEPGYPREIDAQNFDPVLNYLSSTRNVDTEQSSDKLIPGPDLPYATTHPRRHIGQPYACQTSPTPSNTTEKKFMQDHASDRKDPTVKKGLRNWRISSYLSAYDSSGEPEGLAMGQGQIVDPFDDFPHPMQQPTPPPPQAVDFAVSKIPNVREFKVPVLPRASQMPAYGKTTLRDLTKKIPDEIPQVMVVPEPKAPTPTPSESSSTTEGEKQEDVEPREPIASVLRRDDSFRAKYNASVQRGSRLRSSLIFRSLEQSTPQDNSEQDEDKTKTETDQTKLPFSQRRSGAREPFEWRNYIKSSDNAKTEEDTGRQAEKDSESKLESLSERQPTEEKTKDKSQEVAPKIEDASLLKTQIEQPKIEQPPVQKPSVSLLSASFLDMDDPDQRLLFFKELAAKRRAEKAAEEGKLKQKSATKEKDESEKEKQVAKDAASPKRDTTKEDSKKTQDMSGKSEKADSVVKENVDTKVTTDSEKVEFKQNQSFQPASVEKLSQENQEPRTKDIPKPIEKVDKLKYANKPSIPASAERVIEENQPSSPAPATSKDPQLKNSNSVPDFTKKLGLDLLSLPSARIYERTQSQEANKEAAPKSRLWSPSIQRKELLKPFGDKQKSIATVIQIEEGTEEPSETVASDASISQEKNVAFEIGDKSEINQASKESAKTISENKQPQKEISDSSGIENTKDVKKATTSQSPTVLPAISGKVQSEKPLNEGESPSQSKEKSVTPLLKEKTTTISEETIEKSATSAIQVKEDTKDLTSTPKDESELSTKESLNKSTATEERAGPTQSLSSKEPQMSIKDESPVKSSSTEIKGSTEKPSPSRSELTQDEPKTEQQQQGKIAEISNNDKQESTKVASTTEVAKTIKMPDESSEESKNVQVASSRSRDDTKNIDSVEEKPNVVTQEVVEASAKSNSSKDLNIIEEKSSSTLSFDKTDPVPSSIDESKQKYTITYTEEVPPFESHSNTSSPASFATALEFISSEDSDILSPAKNDPQHLFKSGTLESSVSDMSDFQTPNSEISMSPMLSTFDMDDTFEDNVSIAETVIEAASRRKAATTEELKEVKEGDVDISKSEEIEPQHSQLSPETGFDSLNSATAQLEAKSQDGTTKLAKATEVSESESISNEVKAQGLTSQSEKCAVLDIVASTSEEKNENKMEDKPADVTTKDTLMSTKGSEESMDVKSLDPKVSSIKSEAEAVSTNQTTPSSGTSVTKDTETSKESTKTKKVYSRFQTEPSNASAETKVSAVASKAEEVKIGAEIKAQSESITGESSVELQTEGPNLEESESETKAVVSNANNDLSKVETKASPATQEANTVDQTSEATAGIENVVHDKDVSKTEILDNASKTAKNACKPADINSQKDETAPKDEKIESKTEISSSESNQSTSSATSEMITDDKNVDKESEIVNKESLKSAGDENEHKTKDTNDNTKENTSTSESAKASETSAAQPKQPKSRYHTSTANVISSSNLRDDTKILLEQISANSQTRNESSNAKEAPVTDDEKEDEADKNGKRKNDLRSSLGQQKSNQERDKLLERIQTMRKDRKVYSRFEV